MRTHLLILLTLVLLAACDSARATAPAPVVYDGKPLTMGQPPFAFPDNFLFGSAIAQYQGEGTWLPGDKNITSNWSRWEDMGKANGEHSGKASDFREQWQTDIDQMAKLGLTAFRFSLDWGRLETSKGQFDQAEMNHVLDVLKAARAHNIKIFLTFFHWTVPLDVQSPDGCDPVKKSCPVDTLGVYGPEFADRFAAFVAWVVPQVKGYVDEYPIINEPFSVIAGGYLDGELPPGFSLDLDAGRAVFANLAFAHGKAAKLVHTLDDVDADGDGVAASVGCAMAASLFLPLDPLSADDIAAAARLNYVANDAWLDALTTGNLDMDLDGKATNTATNPPEGNYPELKGSLDWIGVNFYGPVRAQAVPGLLSPVEALPLMSVDKYNAKLPHSDLGTEIDPKAFLVVLSHYATRWQLPMYITENGIADDTDVQRPRYLVEHLAAISSAIARGVDVRGYMHWSILDNFEWAHGKEPRLGLFRVDYTKPDLPRTKTTSAGVYADIISQRAIPAELHAKWTTPKYATDQTTP